MTSAALFCVLSLLAPSVRAAQASLALEWKDCVAAALRENPDLAASRRALEASRATYYGSYNGLLPQLSLSNSYGDSKGSDGSSRWGAQASLSMNLLSASDIARVRSASAALASSEAGLRQAGANLLSDLRRAFGQLLYQQQSVEVSRVIRGLRERNARLVSLRYDSGRESKGNMLRAKAESLQADAQLSQALRDLGVAQKVLDRQLGRDAFDAVAVTGTLDVQGLPEYPRDARSLLSGRPDVALQEASVRSAEAALAQSRSALWPSVSASYARSRSGRDEFPASRYNWSFSGTLSIPVFGGGPTAAFFSVSSAQRSLEKSTQALRAARNAAVAEIEGAWADYAGALEQVGVQAALLEASRQRNDEADVRYASGLLSYDNWELIVTDRVSSERQALQARLNAWNALAVWEKALGRTLGD
ncbi:MAG: TolC family protein [Elusimicrobiota bacterium]|jgi:multidrug efflux system outer membrane protein